MILVSLLYKEAPQSTKEEAEEEKDEEDETD